MKIDFKKRSYQKEHMDNFESKGDVISKTLTELNIINQWLGGYKVTISGLNKLLFGKKITELQIADMGCGGGHTLKEIFKWSKKNNYRVKFFGIDANPNIIEVARKTTKELKDIELVTGNVLEQDLNGYSFDIINCTLLIHHFNDEELVLFLKKMSASARIGIVINDLHRNWFAYYSIAILTKLFSRSSMVRNDAPLSVLRAFDRSELYNILSKAGINDYELAWRWAYRWQLVIRSSITQST